MKAAVAISALGDAAAAAADIVRQVGQGLGGRPDALVVFAAPSLDHAGLLRAIAGPCSESLVVGASSAGEFANGDRGEGRVCAIGLRGDDMRVFTAVGRDVHVDPSAAAQSMVAAFRGRYDVSFPYRSALIMTDALAGHADLLVDELTMLTAGQYQFFGGGAGDNAQFRKTSVFFGDQVLEGTAVALEILSAKPIGVGVRHGWEPASPPYRVSEVQGKRLVSLNGLPALEAFQAHARATGRTFDPTDPVPFFLHNILGIDTGDGHRLRVPLAARGDGSVLCAAEVPDGAIVHIMRSSTASAVQAAEEAADAAMTAIGHHRPQAALFFDCVATRLRMGAGFDDSVATVRRRLAGAELVVCNTHGQIARSDGQFGGFHNCTAVIAVLPA